MTPSNTLFLLLFVVIGSALLLSIASLRFANYQLAVRLGRPTTRVWRPFWMKAAR